MKHRGWEVVITGARFAHMAHCPKCRKPVYASREGGTLRFGFDRHGRVFEKSEAGPVPEVDAPCPYGCGARITGWLWSRTGRSALPVADVENVHGREWERLRRRLGVWSVDMTPADMRQLESTRAR